MTTQQQPSPSMRAAAIGHQQGTEGAERLAAGLNGAWLPSDSVDWLLAEAGLPPTGISADGDAAGAAAIERYIMAGEWSFWRTLRDAATRRLAELS